MPWFLRVLTCCLLQKFRSEALKRKEEAWLFRFSSFFIVTVLTAVNVSGI